MTFKKYSPFIFSFLAILLLFSVAQPALALEVTYPAINILGINASIDGSSNLLDYIKYFFVFAIALAGILGIMTIVYSGIRILLAAGSPTEIGDAKERIFGAILGIVLLFASFILISAINPQLVNPTLTALPNQGLGNVILETHYTRMDNGLPFPYIKSEPAQNNPSVQPIENYRHPTAGVMLSAEGATRRIRYNCTAPAGTVGPKLMVWYYEMMQYRIDRSGDSSGTTYLPCNTNSDNSVGIENMLSYRFAVEEPGVRFYLKAGCAGPASYRNYTERSILEPFDDTGSNGDNQRPLSLAVTNDAARQFGLTLNENETNDGSCSYPILNKNQPAANAGVDSQCFDIPYSLSGLPRYANVFQHAEAPPQGSIKFESTNLYVELNQGDFPVGDNRRIWGIPAKYSNLNNWLKMPSDDDPANEQGQGRLLNNLINPDASAVQCRSNVPCLKRITRDGTNAFFRAIIYSANEADFSADTCKHYTCQQDNFDPGNNNRWIFLSDRTVYDVYVIPMPRVACQSS